MQVSQRREFSFSVSVGSFTRDGVSIPATEIPKDLIWECEEDFSDGKYTTYRYVGGYENSDIEYHCEMYIKDLQYPGSGWPAQLDFDEYMGDEYNGENLFEKALAEAKVRAEANANAKA